MRRSRWREFIEARDSVLLVLGAPQSPSQLLARRGLGADLADSKRKRPMQLESARWIEEKLG